MVSMDEWIDSLDKDIISVVIPTFNRIDFLVHQLNKLNNVEYREKLEIIVVSDGGDYNTNDIKISEFSRALKVKHVYYQNNSGTVCIPRNIGISHISGRTIAPVDDDVICAKTKFSKLYGPLWEKDDVLMAYGDRLDFDGLSVKIKSASNQKPKSVGLDNGQFIYKADVYRYIKPVFSINACDWYTYSSFADFGKFVYVNEIVCQYNWHGNNISLIPESQRTNPLIKLPNYLQYFKDGPFKDECVRIANNQNNR